MAGPTSKSGDTQGMWRIAGLGTELVGAIGGMLLIGWGIDALFKTAPWGLVVCGLIGLIGGGYNFIREAVKLQKREAAQAAGRAYRQPPPAAPRGATPDMFGRRQPTEAELEEAGADVRWPEDLDEYGEPRSGEPGRSSGGP